MPRRSPDRLSLAAGLVLAGLGTVLLLAELDVLDLDFGGLAPIVLGSVGAIVLASGLTRGR